MLGSIKCLDFLNTFFHTLCYNKEKDIDTMSKIFITGDIHSSIKTIFCDCPAYLICGKILARKEKMLK